MVVLEDLVLAGGRFGHSTDDMGVDGCRHAALRNTQLFTAKSWDHPALERFRVAAELDGNADRL